MPCSGCCGYGQELSSCWGFDINGQLPVSGALNLKVLERKGDRMRESCNCPSCDRNKSSSVICLVCIAILFQLSSNAKTILYDLLDNLRVILRILAMWGSSRGAAVENHAKRSDVKLIWNLNNG
ncbi:hypothetical protein D5086_014990 [Populus alba]|uniref:Uncharacterized protein n=1 Tax=Populus alba TaxID=43335 RepID=A0ACC4C0K9_POPAL